MKEVSLRELTAGTPAPDRVALLSIWFHGHNNPRYAELLPRLERLDACLLRLPTARIPSRHRVPSVHDHEAVDPAHRARPRERGATATCSRSTSTSWASGRARR